MKTPMNYSEAVAILLKAQYLIRIGHSHHVCLAIEYVAKELKRQKKGGGRTCEQLIAWIQQMLSTDSEFYSLEDWVVDQGYSLSIHDAWARTTISRNTRLAWIDWMIKELKR